MTTDVSASSVFKLISKETFYKMIDNYATTEGFAVHCMAFQKMEGYEPTDKIGDAATTSECHTLLDQAFSEYPAGVFEFTYGTNNYLPPIGQTPTEEIDF